MKRITMPDPNTTPLTETQISELENELDAEFVQVRLTPETHIKHYRHPTVNDLKTILDTATQYTGEWFHSEVHLNMDSTDTEYVQLRQTILEKGRDAGIFIHQTREPDKETRNSLRKLFTQHGINM